MMCDLWWCVSHGCAVAMTRSKTGQRKATKKQPPRVRRPQRLSRAATGQGKSKGRAQGQTAVGLTRMAPVRPTATTRRVATTVATGRLLAPTGALPWYYTAMYVRQHGVVCAFVLRMWHAGWYNRDFTRPASGHAHTEALQRAFCVQDLRWIHEGLPHTHRLPAFVYVWRHCTPGTAMVILTLWPRVAAVCGPCLKLRFLHGSQHCPHCNMYLGAQPHEKALYVITSPACYCLRCAFD